MRNREIKVIGIAGRKRAGKSTAATAILQLAESFQIPAGRIGFAEEIKGLIAEAFDLTAHDCKEQLRPVYQVACDTYKTIRGVSQWLQNFDDRCDAAEAKGYELVVVDDVRFPYEANHLREVWSAHIIRVVSEESNDSVDTHPSENNTEFITEADVIENNGTLAEFRTAVKQAVEEYL